MVRRGGGAFWGSGYVRAFFSNGRKWEGGFIKRKVETRFVGGVEVGNVHVVTLDVAGAAVWFKNARSCRSPELQEKIV